MGQGSSRDTALNFDKDNIPNFKVVLIGEPGVGKSSVYQRYVRNRFSEEYMVTRRAVVENVVKKVNVPGQTLHSVTLWDLPGREDIDLRESYYRNVDAAIVVVDMNDPESIELATAWKQDFINKVSRTKAVKEKLQNAVEVTRVEYLPCDPYSVPVLLLGNKYDVIENQLHEERLRRDLELSEKNKKRKNDASSEESSNSDDEEGEQTDDVGNVPQLDKELKDRIDDKEDEEDDESDEDEEPKVFATQRGPRKSDKKPECVKHLEQVEEDHGFVGSIMVSARDADGSVHAAIESLIRFMLEKKLPPRKKKVVIQKKNKVVVVKEEPKLFTPTGVDDIDALFARCEEPLKCARDYTDYYEIVLQKFKQTCADNGFLKETKASLEDCIIGIRDGMRHSLGLELLVRDKDDFIVLDHQLDHRVKVRDEVPRTLGRFNNEFVPLCEAILRDCPTMSIVLSKLETKVNRKCGNLKETLPIEHQKNIEEIQKICDKNTARVIFAKALNKECLKNVKNAKEKVKTALIW